MACLTSAQKQIIKLNDVKNVYQPQTQNLHEVVRLDTSIDFNASISSNLNNQLDDSATEHQPIALPRQTMRHVTTVADDTDASLIVIKEKSNLTMIRF